MTTPATSAELLELCTRIQGHPDTIPVRVNIRGKWENLFLSEMPAALAVWWAMQFVIRRITGEPGELPPTLKVPWYRPEDLSCWSCGAIVGDARDRAVCPACGSSGLVGL
jgi:hypothetical protein